MTFSSILVGVVKARGDEYDFRARFESFIKEYASADSLTVKCLSKISQNFDDFQYFHVFLMIFDSRPGPVADSVRREILEGIRCLESGGGLL